MTNILTSAETSCSPNSLSNPLPNQLGREHLLAQWVSQQLNLNKTCSLRPITNDAGFRRYYRFALPSQWLAVDAPPQTEDSRQFIELARYLSSYNVHTPTILTADEQQGFLLVEDFGDNL
ncbi:MAG: hypothetical protein EOO68_12655, partial [Moraxellaceae bacterium]